MTQYFSNFTQPRLAVPRSLGIKDSPRRPPRSLSIQQNFPDSRCKLGKGRRAIRRLSRLSLRHLTPPKVHFIAISRRLTIVIAPSREDGWKLKPNYFRTYICADLGQEQDNMMPNSRLPGDVILGTRPSSLCGALFFHHSPRSRFNLILDSGGDRRRRRQIPVENRQFPNHFQRQRFSSDGGGNINQLCTVLLFSAFEFFSPCGLLMF